MMIFARPLLTCSACRTAPAGDWFDLCDACLAAWAARPEIQAQIARARERVDQEMAALWEEDDR